MTQHRQLYATLTDIGRESVKKLDQHPIGGQLVNGTISRSHYLAYLTQVVHQVRGSEPLLREAGERLQAAGRTRLAALLLRKSEEEHLHDVWALEDAESLGLDPKQVEMAAVSPAVAAYTAFWRYLVSAAPIGVFGLAWSLEFLGHARARRAADNLVAHSAIPNVASAVRFLRGHEADTAHVAALAEIFDEITEPHEMSVIELAAKLVGTLYVSFFDAPGVEGSSVAA